MCPDSTQLNGFFDSFRQVLHALSCATGNEKRDADLRRRHRFRRFYPCESVPSVSIRVLIFTTADDVSQSPFPNPHFPIRKEPRLHPRDGSTGMIPIELCPVTPGPIGPLCARLPEPQQNEYNVYGRKLNVCIVWLCQTNGGGLWII